jgi:hypothetical protein
VKKKLAINFKLPLLGFFVPSPKGNRGGGGVQGGERTKIEGVGRYFGSFFVCPDF